MTIAVMFEASGRVRDALLARGYDAVSIDIRETQSPGPHIVGDCFDHLDDGWSGAIMFPTCTHVCGSGFHWNHRVPGRNLMTDRAVFQFRRLMKSRIPRKIAENPVGVLSTRYGKPRFTVQPYELGEDASKRTCFWAEGDEPPSLKLDPAQRFAGRMVEWPRGSGKMVERWSNQTDSGQNALTPSDDRWSDRSETYPGIADMLADQFGEWLSGRSMSMLERMAA
uniref:hypothetical protein n=1 Tax=Sphingomonas bacterium TaxID=1895847 RepID=UPI0026375209|nr:hypothetical protein [Sphingomonas bacterium]